MPVFRQGYQSQLSPRRTTRGPADGDFGPSHIQQNARPHQVMTPYHDARFEHSAGMIHDRTMYSQAARTSEPTMPNPGRYFGVRGYRSTARSLGHHEFRAAARPSEMVRNTPLTNLPEFGPPNRLAISTASLIAALNGTLGSNSNS